MAKACAYKGCGARKAHPIHGSFMKDGHPFMDASKVGLQPMNKGMQAWREQSGYNDDARAARGKRCQIQSPVCTGTADHLHEPLSRGRAGGLRRAVEIGGTVDACDPCNGYVMENQVWAYEHGFLFRATVEGEQAAREAKEARAERAEVQPREKRRRLT